MIADAIAVMEMTFPFTVSGIPSSLMYKLYMTMNTPIPIWISAFPMIKSLTFRLNEENLRPQSLTHFIHVSNFPLQDISIL